MTVRTELSGHAATIWLDRPAKLNALDLEMSAGIQRALDEFADAERPLVIRSAVPGTFVSGADLTELARRTRREALQRVNHRLFTAIEEYPWPSIALVGGHALGGGCELALACDFRLSSESATWGLPEVRLGIIPSAGGLVRLPRIVGASAAKRLILTGKRIGAAEALAIGLVDEVSDDLDAALERLLGELGKASMTAARYAKEAMSAPGDHRRTADAALQALCFESDEARRRLSGAVRR
ncbi:enoyl-CoA hydratase/isomerase family protein [Amycolatopsis sp. K13G38]|uniref:Enoyl-CoA hydratase/isomerase family protein n=1 Tax=Amycolatopsis acididurans TaxID=2724524 RepID=A0ABX1J0G1_9PSEU|nr:enoyl-CoA hydratase/isomerase family protein [Amycolatopsis acididurans]NKQ51772.1 enoyl-CoA hydratase/isomerase family protein [Amycolatopsis acididurans]